MLLGSASALMVVSLSVFLGCAAVLVGTASYTVSHQRSIGERILDLSHKVRGAIAFPTFIFSLNASFSWSAHAAPLAP